MITPLPVTYRGIRFRSSLEAGDDNKFWRDEYYRSGEILAFTRAPRSGRP